jgi:hypothetical protein
MDEGRDGQGEAEPGGSSFAGGTCERGRHTECACYIDGACKKPAAGRDRRAWRRRFDAGSGRIQVLLRLLRPIHVNTGTL